MLYALKRLFLGLFLIAAAAAVLLISDRARRPGREEGAAPRVAVFQFSTRDVLNDSVAGCLAAFKEHGFLPGKNIIIERFSAENDLPTANAIARSIVDGGYRMAVTFSTPALQCMANANREGKVIHVFGTVTDPFLSGVGLDRARPEARPKHLAGIGTFQPVRELWRIAKRANPRLQTVGEVWCQGETCSEACTILGRASAVELGMKLIEAPISSIAELPEALQSILARRVQAVWVGGDNIVESSVPAIAQAALASGVPVLANAASHAAAGALISLGADYFEVGRATGNVAAEILKGRAPDSFPVENVVPQRLVLNLDVLPLLREPWDIPEEDFVAAVEAACREMSPARRAPPPAARAPAGPARPARMCLMHYAESMFAEDCEKGFMEELGRLGLVRGRDYELKIMNAQGQIINLPSMLDAAVTENNDLFLVTSTPTLQSAVHKIKDKPVIFSVVANPALAGAGPDFTNHVSNVTGISTMVDFDGMVKILRECLPQARRFGTLYADNEDNSIFNKDQMARAMRQAGLELEAIGVSSQAEVVDAAKALAGRDIDGICQVPSNIIDASFAGIALAARSNKKPLFCFVSGQVETGGAAVALSRDYCQSGRDMALLAARVLRGESPAGIPIALTSRTILAVNPSNAALCGFEIPESILRRAGRAAGR